jgi:hypothetical protein
MARCFAFIFLFVAGLVAPEAVCDEALLPNASHLLIFT